MAEEKRCCDAQDYRHKGISDISNDTERDYVAEVYECASCGNEVHHIIEYYDFENN